MGDFLRPDWMYCHELPHRAATTLVLDFHAAWWAGFSIVMSTVRGCTGRSHRAPPDTPGSRDALGIFLPCRDLIFTR